MLHPQIVVHERDGQLMELVRPLAIAERWALREPRQAEPLWRFLLQSGPTVLVVKFDSKGSDYELDLIEKVSWTLPDVAIVAVGGPDDAETLAGLAWDLGAAYALLPPQSRDRLPDVVASLMRRAIRDAIPSYSVAVEPPA
jgi:hypothetical protein